MAPRKATSTVSSDKVRMAAASTSARCGSILAPRGEDRELGAADQRASAMGKVLVNTRSARLAGKPGLRSRCALLWQKPHAGGHLGFAGQALYRDSAAMRAAQNALLFEADEVLADGSIG